jgi:WD40 repeat protein
VSDPTEKDAATLDTLASDPAVAPTAAPVSRGDVADASRDEVELVIVDRERYTRGDELARGGMGRIVRARDRRLHRPVALKELLAKDPGLGRRFEREVLLTARLQHPAIVSVYEAGRWPDGDPFYTMRMVPGRALDAVIGETRTLAERLALLPNVIAVVDAMAYAHAQRIIHRDLKPANVLVGPFGETVVIDWGLAKDLADAAADDEPTGPYRSGGEGLTVAGAIMGTPAYMPPEQANGDPLDQRADVYALGAILYHALAGRTPYTGRTSEEILTRVIDGPPPSLVERAPGVPRDLITIVEKAMSPRAADRYPSAAELAADLRRFQTGQLVGAHAYSAWQLTRRWLARHRGAVSVGAAAFVLLAIGGVVSVRGVLTEKARADRERSDAIAERAKVQARSDELAIAQGRARLATDPTTAIAWLKEVSLSGLADVPARFLAIEARALGVARVIERHHKPVYGVAFSSDGRRFASAGGDGVIVRELATGATTMIPSDKQVAAAVFSPDGAELAYGDEEGALRVRKLADGTTRTLIEKGRTLQQLGWSSDGARICVLDANANAQIIDAASGATITENRGGAVDFVGACDGLVGVGEFGAAIRGIDGTIRVFPSEPLSNAVASNDGKRLVTLVYNQHGAGGTANVFSDGSHVELPNPVATVSISPDGRTVATITTDNAAMIFDADGKDRRSLGGKPIPIRHLVWSADSKRLAGFDNGDLRVWDLPSGALVTLRGHSDLIFAIAFSPDGKSIASASSDGTARVWDLSPLDVTPIERHIAESTITLDQRTIYLTGEGGALRRIDTATGAVTELPLRVEHAIATSADGSLLADEPGDGMARRIRVRKPDGTVVFDQKAQDTGALVFTADMRWLIWKIGDPTGFDTLELATGKVTAHAVPHLLGIAAAPSGSAVAITTEDHVEVWDPSDASGARTLPLGARPQGAAFSPDRARLVVGVGPDLVVFDLPSGAKQTLSGNEGVVLGRPLFSPDGTTVITVASDHTLRVWDVASGTGRKLGTTNGLWIYPVRFLPNGRQFVTTGEGELRLWDVASGASTLVHAADTIYAYGVLADGSIVALAVTLGTTASFLRWTDPLPPDAQGFAAWLAAETTLVIQ